MNESLVLSGADFRQVVGGFRLLFTILDGARSEDSVLGNTSRRLKKDQDNVGNLVVCVLGKDCPLKAGQGLHIAGDLTKFNIVSSTAREYKEGWATSPFGGPGTPHLIVLNGGPDPEHHYVSIALVFLNVATKFADFELIYEWIEANVRLLGRGQNSLVDELFTAYVRVRADGKFDMDEGFIRVFLDSRSKVAEYSGFANLIGGANMQDLQQQMRLSAMKDIAHYQSTAQDVIDKYGLSEKNIFEVAERFGHIMTNTIFMAKRPRDPF